MPQKKLLKWAEKALAFPAQIVDILSTSGCPTSQRCVNGQPFLFYGEFMSLPRYQKTHANPAQLVAHLRSKGLIINSASVAAREINLIGYARLRIYFESRRDLKLPGRPFYPGTKYQDVLRIYECDQLLREACFAAVGKFEIMLRNSMSEHLSNNFGNHPYFDESAFKSKKAHAEALKIVINTFSTTKDPRAKYYKKNYSNPPFPPIWYMREFFTFNNSARFLGKLNRGIVQSTGKDFGVPSYDHLMSWVDALVHLRNVCAHHERLFNRVFYKQVQFLHMKDGSSVPNRSLRNKNNRLISLLRVLDYMMGARGSPVNIETGVKNIITRYPEIKAGEIGY